MIWAGRKDDDVPSVAVARNNARTEAEHEYRRLLYVAMTRAKDRLIVCGAEGKNRPPDGCWYNLIRGALESFFVVEGDNEEKVLLYRKPASGGADARALSIAGDAKTDRCEMPSWLRQPAPVEKPREMPISPSSAFDEDIERAMPTAGSPRDRQKALTRGLLVHRLMQSLPDIPPPQRNDAIARYLARAAADFLAAEQAEIARQVLAILDDETFGAVFAPGSRAEVPIVGRIARADADPIAVAGQIDRLSVTNDAVLIADYKTDRAAPRRLDEVPEPYITQLALYRAVLARIYSEKTVRAALIFTAGPHVLEVPDAVLDKALAKLKVRGHAPVNVP
jgi:ATP-dependent helicase/nuclease subunit A